jgi:rfaE bifunctional protein kinase chain/domain/rfaE bifunctional protein nucleotidyltransferase chain/domain
MKNNFESKFGYKIKSIKELKKEIGNFPRKKKVIMCHGTFDIVHPGHVRHLLFAKERADILIVTLTCDKYVSKANYRPFITETLRAINLAVLDFVDYVIIDKNDTPINNLISIKPDFFAKGFEYNKEKMNPKTIDEMKVVQSYGGKMVFSPGDIVFSSSKIIDNSPPDMKNEKLFHLMDSEKIKFDNILDTIKNFKNKKIHIIGDCIIDTFTYCSMIGGMTKTPTMSLKKESVNQYVGGAGIVAKHLAAAGAKVFLTTVNGTDKESKFFNQDIKKFKNISLNLLTDKNRPTTNKNVIICNDHRLLKIDNIDNSQISDEMIDLIKKQISQINVNAVIFSDFRHGIFTKNTIPIFYKAIPKKAFKVADSQVASRWGNILEFKNFDLLTPNEKEARFALADQDTVVRPLGLELYKQTKCKTLILKCGDKGLLSFRSPNASNFRSFFTLDSFAENVKDPVGAGDALLAYSTLSKLVNNNDVIASIIGNVAAGLECEKEGNLPITPIEVINKIKNLRDIKENRS